MRTFVVIAATVVLMIVATATMLGWAVEINNQLVMLDQNVNEKWAQAQNVYQRRADLIPNLVETVKGYAKHESDTLKAVAEARASATGIRVTPEVLNDPKALAKFQAAQDQLSGALSRLLVAVEKYPKLKADVNFRALQEQLEATENRIAVERQRFNSAVLDYNTRVKLFPGNLIAERIGYGPREFFQADANAQKVPAVTFK